MLDAVVALKSLNQAKQRLATVLDGQARRALVEAMALDVMASLSACPVVNEVHVICGAGWSDALRLSGDITLWDEADLGTEGLNAALEAVATRLDAPALVFIHADLPLLQAADIEQMEHVAAGEYAVIASDEAGVGTNALLRWQHQALPLCFGQDSYARHARAASKAAVSLKPVVRTGLSRDIDEAGDLRYLHRGAGDLGYHTQQWCKLYAAELAPTATQSPP